MYVSNSLAIRKLKGMEVLGKKKEKKTLRRAVTAAELCQSAAEDGESH